MSFQKIREDLSPLLKSVHIYMLLISLEVIQKLIESSLNFSKDNRGPTPFSKVVREFQYIHQPIGKRAQNIRKRIQPIEKINQSADALAFFENSNEIQKQN